MSISKKKWNQGKLEQNPFEPCREQAVRETQFDSEAGDVYRRACLGDLPGWLPSDSLCLSKSENEDDFKEIVWSESETGDIVHRKPELRTLWTITQLDPKGLSCQAVLLIPELVMGTLELYFKERDGGCLVRFELTSTVISEAGSSLFDEGIEKRMAELLEGFEGTLRKRLTTEADAPMAVEASLPSSQVRVTHEMTINGQIDECFALACPVAELLWIDDWKFDLVYSESGRNETGCVFLEPSSGLSMLRCPGVNTNWLTTRYDTEEHVFEAIWLSRDLSMARWKVTMSDDGGGVTRVIWSLAFSALGLEGSRILAETGMAERMKRGLTFIGTSLKHYVETGSLYRLSPQRKLKIATSLIGASLGRHVREVRRGQEEV